MKLQLKNIPPSQRRGGTLESATRPRLHQKPQTIHNFEEREQQRQEQNFPSTPSTLFTFACNSTLFSESTLLQNRWLIGQTIGCGSFGVVCEAYDNETKQFHAIKTGTSKRGRKLLEQEYIMYGKIFGEEKPTGFPHPIQFIKNTRGEFLVIPLLGKDIASVYRREQGGLDFMSVCDLGIQMLNRLEYIHRKGVLHLDIKPENMLQGSDKDSYTIYLIDFGLSKCYLDNQGRQIPYKTRIHFAGTRNFASIHVHERIERAPRDDVESLWYTLVLLYKGKLPWTDGVWNSNASEAGLVDLNEQLHSMKLFHRRSLCDDMSPSFQKAWQTISEMQYGDIPDYSWLKELLIRSFEEHSAE